MHTYLCHDVENFKQWFLKFLVFTSYSCYSGKTVPRSEIYLQLRYFEKNINFYDQQPCIFRFRKALNRNLVSILKEVFFKVFRCKGQIMGIVKNPFKRNDEKSQFLIIGGGTSYYYRELCGNLRLDCWISCFTL